MKIDIIKLLKETRTFYGSEEIAKDAPTNSESESVEFFKLDRYVSDDELEKEYTARGLVPATLQSLALYDKDNQVKMDEIVYVGTHWKDKDENWCFATFGRRDDRRNVSVYRSGRDWRDRWWFAGLRKLGTKSSEPQPSALDILSFEKRLVEVEARLDKYNLN